MSIENQELFWDASTEDLMRGYSEDEEAYRCLICEEEFTKGCIYEVDGKLYDGAKATKLHIAEKHGSMLTYLLQMNPSFLGISQIQQEVMGMMAKGVPDKDIAKQMGVAASTIRNHRFKLREKEKQAKLFLTTMALMGQETNKKVKCLEEATLCDAHKTATTLDDRYNITDKERTAAIKAYMDEHGAIKTFPAKEKKKIIVLSEVVKNFSKGKSYSEKEINRILQRIYEDYATIRRALIEYGFIERSDACSDYWVKE